VPVPSQRPVQGRSRQGVRSPSAVDCGCGACFRPPPSTVAAERVSPAVVDGGCGACFRPPPSTVAAERVSPAVVDGGCGACFRPPSSTVAAERAFARRPPGLVRKLPAWEGWMGGLLGSGAGGRSWAFVVWHLLAPRPGFWWAVVPSGAGVPTRDGSLHLVAPVRTVEENRPGPARPGPARPGPARPGPARPAVRSGYHNLLHTPHNDVTKPTLQGGFRQIPPNDRASTDIPATASLSTLPSQVRRFSSGTSPDRRRMKRAHTVNPARARRCADPILRDRSRPVSDYGVNFTVMTSPSVTT
jgi:hypothetical protein